jgi:hypothetical protein
MIRSGSSGSAVAICSGSRRAGALCGARPGIRWRSGGYFSLT